jgi:hypothetical protein
MRRGHNVFWEEIAKQINAADSTQYHDFFVAICGIRGIFTRAYIQTAVGGRRYFTRRIAFC